MIFITVGAQMPFDRMIAIVDRWAGGHEEECFAQIGQTDFTPENISYAESLAQSEYEERIKASRLIIAHAGMGSILTAMRYGKPVLIFPRRGDLKETRNDHQVATVRHFRDVAGVYVAETEEELVRQLEQLDDCVSTSQISAYASDQLLDTIGGFIDRIAC